MKREVLCLYKRLLKPNGKVLNLKKMIGFYEEYHDFRNRVLNSPEAPWPLKNEFKYSPTVKMPLYLKWAKKYMVEDE